MGGDANMGEEHHRNNQMGSIGTELKMVDNTGSTFAPPSPLVTKEQQP
jgi:hypothetical protein